MPESVTPQFQEIQTVKVRAALGRVLAQEIVPAINVPAHDNPAMDGYAVRFAALTPAETRLQELGTALAGKPFKGKVGAGQCVRVMTGAVMPQGTDTVVIQEIVKAEGKTIVVPPGLVTARTCSPGMPT